MSERPTSGTENRSPSPHLDEHLCLDLLQGFLSPSETRKILAHVAVCPSCETLLRERAAENERITATRTLREFPDGSLVLERRGSASATREKTPSTLSTIALRAREALIGGVRMPRYRLAGAVALAAVVLLVLVWPRGPRISGGLELPVLPSYSFQLESRDVPESRESEGMMAGVRAYEEREFGRAARLLQAVEASELDEVDRTIRQIYLGSALAWTGQHEAAIRVLETVPFSSVPAPWGREAHWTLLVALEGAGHHASADSLLKILAEKPGEIGDRARRILEP